ncbi:MAG TPA: sigma-70 family RNA polymerase sigma factor, partial [Flavihumibacter sp.]|nr:sigma-70 family RNA polymerase sigma factor [Flavihumibacter sp.]
MIPVTWLPWPASNQAVMQQATPDNDIIQLVKTGDQQAYATLIERYQQLVFSIVLRYVDNREDAEELAQDVFVKAYRSLADFRGDSKFSTWLYSIASTTCLSFLRKRKPDLQSLDNEKVSLAASQLAGGITANQVEQKSRIAWSTMRS